MITTGIIHRIDDLGRVVIPKEIRRQLKVNEGDPFEIFMTKKGEVVLKPCKQQQEYTLHRCQCWEELVDPNGKVICGNHKLDATEILNALGIQYVEEEDQSSSFGGPLATQIFYYTTPRIFCQGKMLHKFLYKKSQNFVRSHKFHFRIVQNDEILIIFCAIFILQFSAIVI